MVARNHVRAVQERRRSHAAGPHGVSTVRDAEPCVCDTAFTCLAREHVELDVPRRD